MKLPDYWLLHPKNKTDETTEQSFDRLWQSTLELGQNPVIDYTLPEPKWQFLNYQAENQAIVFHGSGANDISLFEPRQSNDLREFGNRKAVYASSDGIWAMFFAIAARSEVPMSVTNACIRLKAPDGDFQGPFYFFSVSRQVLGLKPWRDGFVYLLPRSTFISQPPMQLGEVEVHIAQLASLEEVKPLARLPVTPDDFPFLADIRGHDDARLEESACALETGAPLPE